MALACLAFFPKLYLRAPPSAVSVLPGVPAASFFGPRGLPGSLVGGAVAVVVSAAVVFVGLPVADCMNG